MNLFNGHLNCNKITRKANFILRKAEIYYINDRIKRKQFSYKSKFDAVEAGKTYFLQQKVEAGLWKARTNLVLMSETEGRKKLGDVHLSVFEKKAK